MSTNAVTPPASSSHSAVRKSASGPQDSTASNTQKDFLSLLLDLGIDPNVQNPDSEAVLDFPTVAGNTQNATDSGLGASAEGFQPPAAPDFIGLGMWLTQAVTPPIATALPTGIDAPTTNDSAISTLTTNAAGTDAVQSGTSRGGASPADTAISAISGPESSLSTPKLAALVAASATDASAAKGTTTSTQGGPMTPLGANDPPRSGVSTPIATPIGAADVSTANEKPLDKPFQMDPPAAPEATNSLRHFLGWGPETTTVHRSHLSSLPDSPAFQAELVSEVRFMLKGGLQQAELHMNPEDLGPIQIELNLRANVADIGFNAANATTRDGISQSLPQLKDMLGQQGLSLGQTSVGSQNAGQQQPSSEQARTQPGAVPHDGRPSSPTETVRLGTTPNRRPGGLDLYA